MAKPRTMVEGGGIVVAEPRTHESRHVENLRRFFDHFLKGADNGWAGTPGVRYAVLDMKSGARIDQAAATFPRKVFDPACLYPHQVTGHWVQRHRCPLLR